MFNIKSNIAAGFALAVFLASSAALAEDVAAATANTDTAKPANADAAKATKKKPVKKKRTKAAPKPAAAAVDTAPKADAATPPADAAVATTTQNAPSTPPSDNVTAPVAAPTPSSTVAKANAAPQAKIEGDDSPDAIKQRSGSGDPVAGKDKSELCQGCHGEEGISAESTAPKLAGQYAGYIIKQIRDFRSGLRVHQIMSDVAKTVNEEDLPDIAAYFASRKKMKGNGSDNKVGQELYLHGNLTPDMSKMVVACVNCHGVNGKGKTPSNPVFPVLGGQHKDYLRVQINNFRSGDRGNSPGGVMNIITQKLTDAEVEALADYISGL